MMQILYFSFGNDKKLVMWLVGCHTSNISKGLFISRSDSSFKFSCKMGCIYIVRLDLTLGIWVLMPG